MKRSKYGFGSLRKRGEIWHIRYRVNGEPREESTDTTDKAKAEDLLKQRLAEISKGEIDASPKHVTIADLCELVMADYRLRELRTLKGVEWKYNAHIKDTLGPLKAARFGAAQIREYVAQRRKEGAVNSTINRELALVRRGFSLGRKEEPPLVHAVPYIPNLEEDNVRQGFIEEADYQALLSALPDDLKAAFVVGYFCGTRLGELRKMLVPQLDLEARVIRIQKAHTKTKKTRIIPVYADMPEWLEWQLKRVPAGCPYLFFRRKGSRVTPIGPHVKGWSEACAKAGLDGLLFHDLRRSAVRNMDRAGIRRGMGMRVSGHLTQKMYERYDIISDNEFGELEEKMAAYRQKQKPKLKLVK